MCWVSAWTFRWFQGLGKDQLAVSDYVKGMSIVGADGIETNYTFPSDDQDNDNALKVIRNHKFHVFS